MDREITAELDSLSADVAARAFGDERDGELMRRAIDLLVRMGMRLEDQAEGLRTARRIIEQLRRGEPTGAAA